MIDASQPTAVDWPCETCGKHGTPDAGHVLYTSGSLRRGNLRAHTFCPVHDPRKPIR